MYLVIFAGFLLVHLFIFRDIVASIPAIFMGNEILVREELVPFFSFNSQFWSDGTSALTSSEEVRVAYSFWTAWVRHYMVLPFAIVILNACSAFILFYAFYRFGKRFAKKEDGSFAIVAAVLAAMLLHGILLYAKVTHFYTLIFGFSLFALSLTLVLEQLFFKRRLSWRNVLGASLLTLFNPAIHYHVIFYLIFFIFIVWHLFFIYFLHRKEFWFSVRRNILFFATVTAISLIPYGILIIATTASSLNTVANQIPINYWMIYYTSIAPAFALAFDTAGSVDMFKYGNYIAPMPRIAGMLITFLIIRLFLTHRWQQTNIAHKAMLLTLLGSMLLAIWMSIGYSMENTYSFHMMLSGIVQFLQSIGGPVADTLTKLVGTFINILRFPHRFQFIYFYLAGILLTIALIWLRRSLANWFKSRGKAKPRLAIGLVVFIALLPLLGAADYRSTLMSGNYSTFLKPYPIPDDLKRIKSQLEAHTGDKRLLIFPTLEGGAELQQGKDRYGFIDKFFIYYLNQPTLYYGTGSNTENKLAAFLMYRALLHKEDWAEDVIIHNLGISHVFVPKTLQERETGTTYLPQVNERVYPYLAKSKKFKKTYDGEHFALFETVEKQGKHPTLVDLEWQNFHAMLKARQMREHAILPFQYNRTLMEAGKYALVTDNPERSFYSLYSVHEKKSTFYPNSVTLPFTKKLVPSSIYTNSALSLNTLDNIHSKHNYLREKMPNPTSLLSGQFIGLPAGSEKLAVDFKVPENGTYRVLLRAASRDQTITTALGGQLIPFKKVATKTPKHPDYADFTYFMSDITLKKGSHQLEIQPNRKTAVLIESLSVIAARDVPHDYSRISNDWLEVAPGEIPGLYTVILKKPSDE